MGNLKHYTKLNLDRGFLGKISTTTWLIIVNVLCFIIFNLILLVNQSFINYIAIKPSDFIEGKYLWTILTSMFMHANLMHLFFNMFSLFFIGKFVERIIGKKRFFAFYMIAGITAGILFALLSGFFGNGEILGKILGNPDIPGVGASGAIFGLLGLLALITPKARVHLIVGPLIAIVIQVIFESIPNSNLSLISSAVGFIASVYIILCLFVIFSFNPKWLRIALPWDIPFYMIPFITILPLIIVGFFVDLPIGNMAHLAGFFAGAIYGIYLRAKYPNKIKMLNKFIGAK
jgi:membrane associated rhomboid family serine protease